MSSLFKDKAFEEAVKKGLKLEGSDVTKNDLKEVRGLYLSEEDISSVAIYWHSDSDAYNMVFPNVFFNVRDSENGLWREDLKLFKGIKSLYYYVPSINLNFLDYFKNLRELYVKYSIEEDWSFLESLSNLKFLSLSHCHNIDLKCIVNLYSRQSILVSKSPRLGMLMDTKLTNLRLFDCNLEDISLLSECPDLFDLILAHNSIKDVSPLANSNAYYLSLRYNSIESVESLSNLKGIYYLNVSYNKIKDISPLCDIASGSFSKLIIHDNPIEDYECLKNLSGVRVYKD